MPRRAKGPRLYLRPDERVWVIRDGASAVRTGCVEEDREEAEKKLSRYIVSKYEPNRVSRRPEEMLVADVLMIYAEEHGPTTRRPELIADFLKPLGSYWGEKVLSQVRAQQCRQYSKKRRRDGVTEATARRELEVLRAAINYYHREYGLDAVPSVTLPEKAPPRERWLRRDEVASLLRAARKTGNHHVARFILIGLYTGTRSGAILRLQWQANTFGGWVDLDRGVMYRLGEGQRQTKKRQPPMRLPNRLIAHLKRWQRLEPTYRFVIHRDGARIHKLRRSWRTVCDAAQLQTDVVPHTLRHTCATWLMQLGTDMWEASGFLGMSVKTLQDVYGHHHPDFQQDAAKRLSAQKPHR